MKSEVAVSGVLVGYAWATTSVAPFSAFSYLLVATPCVAFIASYARLGGLSKRHVEVTEFYATKASGVTISSVAPWIALLIAAVTLEVVGLSLGGRSTSVPTLSTAVDELLAVRWERFLICAAWLFAGALPLRRLRQQVRTRGS
jgi:hypothetical protein